MSLQCPKHGWNGYIQKHIDQANTRCPYCASQLVNILHGAIMVRMEKEEPDDNPGECVERVGKDEREET